MAAPPSELRTRLAAFDRDADGRISAAGLRLCVKAALGEDVAAEVEAEKIVASADADGDGLLSESEFAALAQEEGGRCAAALREAFGMYEMEGEGCITPTSLRRMLARLGSEQGVDDCHAMIRRFDLDGDGVLSFDEFKIMMSA